jgi:hypothetical protein
MGMECGEVKGMESVSKREAKPLSKISLPSPCRSAQLAIKLVIE